MKRLSDTTASMITYRQADRRETHWLSAPAVRPGIAAYEQEGITTLRRLRLKRLMLRRRRDRGCRDKWEAHCGGYFQGWADRFESGAGRRREWLRRGYLDGQGAGGSHPSE